MLDPIDNKYLNFDIFVNTFGNFYYIYLVFMECEGCRLQSFWLGQTSSPYKRRLRGAGYFNGFYNTVYMFIYINNNKLEVFMKFNDVNRTDFILDLSKIEID